MKNADKPITPFEYEERRSGSPSYHPKDKHMHTGLNKREYFAGQIMQGLISNVDSEKYSLGGGQKTDSAENKAKFCIIMADELLKQLELHTGGQAL